MKQLRASIEDLLLYYNCPYKYLQYENLLNNTDEKYKNLFLLKAFTKAIEQKLINEMEMGKSKNESEFIRSLNIGFSSQRSKIKLSQHEKNLYIEKARQIYVMNVLYGYRLLGSKLFISKTINGITIPVIYPLLLSPYAKALSTFVYINDVNPLFNSDTNILMNRLKSVILAADISIDEYDIITINISHKGITKDYLKISNVYEEKEKLSQLLNVYTKVFKLMPIVKNYMSCNKCIFKGGKLC